MTRPPTPDTPGLAAKETLARKRGGPAMSEWREGAARCTSCSAWKPAEDFPANPRMRDGRSSHCRVCHAAASKRWREANRDYVDAVNAARREEYAAEHGQLERQCENCGRTFARSRRDARTCSQRCRDRLAHLRRRGQTGGTHAEKERRKVERRRQRRRGEA